MSKGKISLRQTFLIFIVLACSPIIRYTTGYSAAKARQAAWLAPLPAVITLFIMLFILHSIFKKHTDKSMMEVIYEIFGVWVGKIIVFFYFLWSLLLITIYLRYDVERLIGSAYPGIPMYFILLITLLVIAYILPKGITNIGRMSEILFLVIMFAFVILCLCMIQNIRMDSVLPVSTKEVLPILQGSMVTTAIGSYFFLMFFIGEFINDKAKLLKSGISTIVFFILFSAVIVFEVVGTLTSSVTQRIPFAYLVAVKQISILDTIEKIESIVVGVFIFSDFILLTVLIFISLNIIKSLSKLKETNHLLNIYLVLLYLLTLGLTINRFDLETFSMNFLVYINSTFGVIIPIILFIVGKIRKKI
ncbi:MAG: gerKB4 [Bacillales bacterium]|jgi:spore germination protein (amino acid permease)|nr:gerKB4 [Bacillales bacterium]